MANESEFIETIYEKIFPKPKPPPQHWLLAYMNRVYSDATEFVQNIILHYK